MNDEILKAFSDYFDNAVETFKDRLGNPFILSFFISWSLINFDVYIIIFTKSDLYQKIGFFNIYFLATSTCKLFWYPLLSMISYVVFSPLLMSLYSNWNLLIQLFSRWITAKIKQPDYIEKHIHNNVKSNLLAQIDLLKTDKYALESKLAAVIHISPPIVETGEDVEDDEPSKANKLVSIINELTTVQVQILKTIKHHVDMSDNNLFATAAFAKFLKTPRSEIFLALGQLAKADLIHQYDDYVELTSYGLEVAISLNN